jgi:hypothetical protein
VVNTKPCVGAPYCRKKIFVLYEACEDCWNALPKVLREELSDAIIAARDIATPETIRRLDAVEAAAREVIRARRRRRRSQRRR